MTVAPRCDTPRDLMLAGARSAAFVAFTASSSGAKSRFGVFAAAPARSSHSSRASRSAIRWVESCAQPCARGSQHPAAPASAPLSVFTLTVTGDHRRSECVCTRLSLVG